MKHLSECDSIEMIAENHLSDLPLGGRADRWRVMDLKESKFDFLLWYTWMYSIWGAA
jgi:hypothetical protein